MNDRNKERRVLLVFCTGIKDDEMNLFHGTRLPFILSHYPFPSISLSSSPFLPPFVFSRSPSISLPYPTPYRQLHSVSIPSSLSRARIALEIGGDTALSIQHGKRGQRAVGLPMDR